MILGLPIYKFIAFIVLNILYLGIIIFLRIDAWRLEKQCKQLKNDNDYLYIALSCKNELLTITKYKNKEEALAAIKIVMNPDYGSKAKELLDKENFDES